MSTTDQTCRKVKRTRFALGMAVVFVILVAGVYAFGYVFEFEYPFWPTLWLAQQTKTSDGRLVSDLIRTRSGNSYADEHWHHCTFCDDVYPYAPHMAVKVYINTNVNVCYLFDWDSWHRKLLPITVRTAQLVPELIPAGSFIEQVGDRGNPNYPFQGDRPCLFVTRESSR
jgi:hypothetical protein